MKIHLGKTKYVQMFGKQSNTFYLKKKLDKIYRFPHHLPIILIILGNTIFNYYRMDYILILLVKQVIKLVS